MLNPDLDKASLAARYGEDGRVRIEGLFETSVAERLRAACSSRLRYDFLFHMQGNNYVLSHAEMQQMTDEQARQMKEAVAQAASGGVGFYYCGYKLGRENRDTDDDELRFLHEVFDFLNGNEMLQLVRDITGVTELASADAQYTRYTPGHFLTRHRDDSTREDRRVAYVYSMSRGWHPDWGGLLQFFSDDGAPRDAWTPTFNALALFDVRHVHSVTFVTPFAREPRYSLTGWFRGPDAPAIGAD